MAETKQQVLSQHRHRRFGMDGDLTDKCGVGIEDTAEKQEEEELPSEDTDPADVATFIPVVARKMTEKETIRKSVHHRQPTEDRALAREWKCTHR